MEREPVQSGSIRSVGYEAETSTLEIEFQTGTIYQYSNVPSQVYDGLMRAPSKGSYLQTQIRSRYPYRQIR